MPAGWQIQLERSGGFAGIPLTAGLDSGTLDEGEAAELDRLASAVDFTGYRADGELHPDAFQYHILVAHNGQRHELRLGESQLTSALKDLVGWLMQRARRS